MTQNPSELEERLDRDLGEALRTAPLSAEAIVRIEAAVRQEWRSRQREPEPARRRLWLALAAAVGSVALMLAWVTRPLPTPGLFGSVARIENGVALIDSSSAQHQSVRAGDVLRTGDELTALGVGLVSLPSGSNLRIAADTVIRVLGASDVELLRGMIYVDHPSAASASSQLRIHTRAGTIEHVGTAFEVFSNEQIVRLRVREGQVRIRNTGHDIVASAGTELVARADGTVSTASWPLNGDSWLWVSSLAPNYEIEGQPLLAFLEFEARELGYELTFADAHAREVAQRTILHGTVRGREPRDAIASVLATTSLSYSIRGNTLQVQSSGGT